MKLRRWTAALVLAAALVPPVALADSAGDQQYVDPLASATTPSPHPARTHHVSAQAPAVAPPVVSAPADPATVATATATATPTAAADPPGSPSRLPYTGVNLLLLTACGGVLLVAGVLLRRVARAR